MFRGSRIARRILLVPAFSALISLSAPAITLPPGFSDSLVTAVGAPTALAFTPDGRLLITTQGGTLRIVQGGTLLGAAALTLGSKVCSNSERGLLGVAVDPAFTSNRFVYLFYTFNKNNAGCPTSSQTSPVERVSRFTLPDTNVIDPASELVLIDNVLNFAGNHNGGDVRFGTDAATLSAAPPDFANQGGQVGRDYDPDNIVVHRGIAMYQAVPHSYDLEPRNSRETRPRGGRYLRGRLAYDFDESFEGRGEDIVDVEVPTFLAGDGSDGSPRVIDHILEKDFVLRPLHKAERPLERPVAGSVG